MRRKIWATGILSIVLSFFIFKLFNFNLDTYSSTLLAFSYQQNGFGSRILMGSIFTMLCSIFPGMDNAMGASFYSFGCSLIFDIVLILFANYLLSKMKNEKAKKGWSLFASLMLIILIPSFSTLNNLGKPDALILALVIGQTYLLMESKHEWLVPIITVICALFHEGFLFMVACVPIGITLHKAMNDDKYWKLFWINLVTTGLITGIMMIIKLPYNLAIFDTTMDRAVHLSLYDNYAINILNQRFGQYSLMENVVHSNTLKPIKQLFIYLAVLSPILIGIIKTIKGYFKKDPVNMVGFMIMFILISVQYVMFCDYGRYVGWTLFAIMMFIGYLACKDEEPLTLAFQKYWIPLMFIAPLCTPLQSCWMSLFIEMIVR